MADIYYRPEEEKRVSPGDYRWLINNAERVEIIDSLITFASEDDCYSDKLDFVQGLKKSKHFCFRYERWNCNKIFIELVKLKVTVIQVS